MSAIHHRRLVTRPLPTPFHSQPRRPIAVADCATPLDKTLRNVRIPADHDATHAFDLTGTETPARFWSRR